MFFYPPSALGQVQQFYMFQIETYLFSSNLSNQLRPVYNPRHSSPSSLKKYDDMTTTLKYVSNWSHILFEIYFKLMFFSQICLILIKNSDEYQFKPYAYKCDGFHKCIFCFLYNRFYANSPTLREPVHLRLFKIFKICLRFLTWHQTYTHKHQLHLFLKKCRRLMFLVSMFIENALPTVA